MSWNTAPKWIRPVATVVFVIGAVGLKIAGVEDVNEILTNTTLAVTVVSGLLGILIGKNGG